MTPMYATILATSLLVLQALQPPSPSSRVSKGNPPQNQTQSAQRQAKAEQRGTEESPLGVKILPPTKSNEETSQEKKQERDISAANWWMVRLTAIISGIALLQLLVFGLQAYRLRQTIQKMDEIARDQAKDMSRYIEQATRSAGAMEKVAEGIAVSTQAAKESVAALSKQMRAYITVTVWGAAYQQRHKNTKFAGTPQMLNTGLTPARNVAYRAKAAVLPVPLPENFEFPLPEKVESTAVVGAHQNMVMNAVVDDFVPDEEVEVIKSGTGSRAMYCWGVVNYEDVFGESHETKFCQILTWLKDEKQTVWGYYTRQHNDAS